MAASSGDSLGTVLIHIVKIGIREIVIVCSGIWIKKDK